MDEKCKPLAVGNHGEYHWLILGEGFNITWLIGASPDVVLYKYIVVTSIDSGALQLTEQEKRDGWWTSEEGKFFLGSTWGFREDREDWRVAYSPCIGSIHGLPNETHDECCEGFDEWFVFEDPVAAGEIESFVNWGSFHLNDPDWPEMIARFWAQIEHFMPESYLSENTLFTFVTRNPKLFAQVLDALNSSEASTLNHNTAPTNSNPAIGTNGAS